MIKSGIVIAILAMLLAMPFATKANMAPPQGYRLGVAVEKTQEGLRIVSLNKDSAAAHAGLMAGDIILAVDGRYAKAFSERDVKALTDDMHSWPMKLIIVRGDEVISLRVPS